MNRRNLLLAALTGAAGISSSPARAQAVPVKMGFRLDWRPGAQHAPFYLGKARGYYATEGIDLIIISGSGSADAVKQLGARAIDLALVDALVLVQAAEQEVPVRSIGAYYQRTPVVLMSPRAKPVTDVKQLLQGVRLGVKKGSATYQGLLALLAANGITPEQVTLADIGFGVQPMLLGQVDAMMGFAMNEPLEAEDAGMSVAQMPASEKGVHAYGLTLASNNTVLAAHADAVAGFLRATRRAVRETIAEPDKAVRALAAAVPEIGVVRETKVLAATVPYWAAAEGATEPCGQTESGWGQTIATAKALGLVDTPPKASTVYVTGLAT